MTHIPNRIKKLKKDGMVQCTNCMGYGSIKRVRLSGSEYRPCRKCRGQGYISWVDDLKGEGL